MNGDDGKPIPTDPGIRCAIFSQSVDRIVLALIGRTPVRLQAISQGALAAYIFGSPATEKREREMIAEMYRPSSGKHIRRMRDEGRAWTFEMALYREIGFSLQRLKDAGKIRLIKGKHGGWERT